MALDQKTSQIDQIKIKDKTYDINVPKSWAENNPAHVQYIKDRTHYQELLEGKDIQEIAQYSFKNVYAQGSQIYSDNWIPQQPWIYAGWPCTHENNAKAHAEDLTCSGGWYEANFYSVSQNGTTTEETKLIDKAKIWINPYQKAENSSNEVQLLIDFSTQATIPDAWKQSKIYYNTAGYFYLTGEPVTSPEGTQKSAQNRFTIEPVLVPEYTYVEASEEAATYSRYRRYLYTKRLDSVFLPLDGKTIRRDNNGNLTAEDIYTGDFQVTEQFGRYEPLEWVPAEGRSVRDVLNDAFCTDKLPSKTEPFVSFYVDASDKTTEVSHYEVGSTVDLDWEFRLNKGSYTYGLITSALKVVNEKDSNSKAYSNYQANSFAVTINTNNEQLGTDDFDNFAFEGEFEDDCLTPDKAGTNYRILKENKPDLDTQTKIKLPAEPITEFTMSLSVDGSLHDEYNAATMLGEIPNPLVKFSINTLTHTTPNILTSDYKWFWTYSSDVAPTNLTSTEIRAFEGQLGGFPKTVETNKMQSMCFFMPKVRAKFSDTEKTLENLDTSVEVLNDATGASACLKMSCKEVVVQDAGKNDHDYLMYYFTNDAQDSGTNIYEIIVNDLEEGGNS